MLTGDFPVDVDLDEHIKTSQVYHFALFIFYRTAKGKIPPHTAIFIRQDSFPIYMPES